MTCEILEVADKALTGCLNLRRDEKLLVVCDPLCWEIGNAFYQAGVKRCKEAVMVIFSPRKQDGNEPPEPTGKWFSQFDVAVMPTSKSLTHTQARREASQKGTRIATLPGINSEVFLRTMKTDLRKLGIITRKVAGRLSTAQKIRITSSCGTDLTFETGGRAAKADDGCLTSKGAYGNLPAGEAFLAPLEGTAEGRLVIDGSFPLFKSIPEQPLVLKVKEGRVCAIEDHPCAGELEKIFIKYHPLSRNIAEFGVGTLDTAQIRGNILEDEKVRGTVHVAIGDNASMGGTVCVPVHLDGVLIRPDVWLDGRLWMKDGELI
jgi:leucyl aminopeptidase (aminopeptidase T)